jgi:acyl-CoA synthetase (AMP-forming)/AMP-acid ligase II
MDDVYGEVPAAFLQSAPSVPRTPNDDLQVWVNAKLGRHKVPVYIFWLGDPGVCSKFPATGSGKIKKSELRVIGNALTSQNSRGPSHTRF